MQHKFYSLYRHNVNLCAHLLVLQSSGVTSDDLKGLKDELAWQSQWWTPTKAAKDTKDAWKFFKTEASLQTLFPLVWLRNKRKPHMDIPPFLTWHSHGRFTLLRVEAV
jgi:hypothetical protein